MTSSSPLQSLPAPLRSMLRDPTAIAVLASIGVHGLLWVVLPYLPLSARQPTEAEIQREVGLVELSPEELARVPQFDTPAAIPLPTAPLPPTGVGRLPQQFSLNPAPPPPSFPLTIPPSSLYIPPIDRSLLIPRTPQPRPRSTTPTTRQTPRPTPTPTPTPAATPTPTPTPVPSPTPGATTSPEGFPIPGARDLEQTPSPSPTGTPSPSAGGNSDQPNATPSVPPRRTDEQIAELRAQQQRDREFIASYNPAGTIERRGEVTAVIQAWTTDIAAQLPETEEGGQIDRRTINIPTSRETCLVRRPLIATYGVLVDGSGDRIGQPRRLMSTGFSLLDERAIAAVREFSIENETGANKAFAVDVRFQFDADECPPIEPASPPASEGTS